MLTSRNEYKKLIGRREILRLIYDMRCFRIIQREDNDLIKGGSAQYVFLKHMNLENRLKRIIELVEEGYTAIHKYPEAQDELYAEASILYAEHRDKTENIRDLENEILKLELACPRMESPIIEIAIFAEALPEDYLSRKNIVTLVGKLLALVPHAASKDIKDYLTQVTTIQGWYSAYFFENSSLKSEDIEDNFQSILLSSITYPSIERAPVIKEAILGYTNKKPTSITEDTLKKLIYNGIKPDSKLSNKTLDMLGASSQRIDFDTKTMFEMLVQKAIPENLDDEKAQINAKRLFDASIRVLPIKKTINDLACALSFHPKGDIAAGFLDTYMRDYLNMVPNADEFTNKYLTCNEQFLTSKQLNMLPIES